jgi:hypothetical protein
VRRIADNRRKNVMGVMKPVLSSRFSVLSGELSISRGRVTEN